MGAFKEIDRIRMGLATVAILILLSSCQSSTESSSNEPVAQTLEIPTAIAFGLPTASPESNSVEATGTPSATIIMLPTAIPESDQEQATINPGLVLLYQAGREHKEIYELTSAGSRLVSPGDLVAGQPFSPDGEKVIIVIEPSPHEEGAVSSIGILNLENGVIESLDLLGIPRTVFWSPDGKQLMYIQRDDDASQLVIYDFEKGENAPIVETQSVWMVAGWSASGRMAAFVSDTDDRYDLYIIDIDSLEARRITDTIDIESAVSWSPVADELLVGETAFGPQRFEGWPFLIDKIYLIDGEGNRTALGSFGQVLSGSLAWSADGDSIAYSDGSLCLLALDTGQKTCPLESLPSYNEYYAAFGSPPVWSPDDEWLAFRATGHRNNSNCNGVYILELSTNRLIVVEEGSCETGPLYWVGQ